MISDISPGKFLCLWGKTTTKTPNSLEDFYPVVYHMADVMVVGQELAKTPAFHGVFSKIWELIKITDDSKPTPNSNEVQSFIWFILAMHDMGKISPHFQNRGGNIIVNALERYGFPIKFTPEKSNHPGLGMKIFDDLASSYKIPRRVKTIIRKVILGHHGRFDDQNSSEHPMIKKEWKPIRERIWNLFLEILNCHPDKWRNLQINHASIVGISLQSLLVLSDWLASNEKLFHWQSLNQIPSEGDLSDILSLHIESSRMLARNVLQKMGFNSNLRTFLPENISLQSLFAQFNFTNLYSIQELANRLTGQEKVVILEAMMGDGKTEAALTIASKIMQQQHSTGFYVALPTTATSNQMFKRIQEFLGIFGSFFPFNTQLVHGRAWVVDKLTMDKSEVFGFIEPEYKAEIQEYFDAFKWFEAKRRALLSPFAVGTIDQALMAVLNVKFGFLRLLGLTNKILILDEVHAYDAYMMEIFDRLLEWASILDIPVILLSATLPEKRKQHIFSHYLEAKQKYGVLDSLKFSNSISTRRSKLEISPESREKIKQTTSKRQTRLNESMTLKKPTISTKSSDITSRSQSVLSNNELEELKIAETGSELRVESYPMISFVDRLGNIGIETMEKTSCSSQKKYHIYNLPGTEGNTDRMGSIIVNTIYQILKTQTQSSDNEGKERDFGCQCVLVNTVSMAQELFRKLEIVLSKNSPLREDWVPNNTQVLLFHSRYTVEDRESIENLVKKYFGKNSLLSKYSSKYQARPANTILVATQVVEQSLDLDFDLMFTELAPIDLLVQRMGRVWRHSREYRPTSKVFPNPTVFIFGATFPPQNQPSYLSTFFYSGSITDSSSWLSKLSELSESNEKKNTIEPLEMPTLTNSQNSKKKILEITGNSKYIYSPYLLVRTQIILDALTHSSQNTFSQKKSTQNASFQDLYRICVEFPRDLRELVERVYQPLVSFPPPPRGRKPAYLSSAVDELDALFKKYNQNEEESSQKTLQYLIPPPISKTYRYAETYQKAFEEGEEHDGNSAFKAKTRLITDNCSIILIKEGSRLDSYYQKKKDDKIIPNKWKKEFLMRSVSIRYSIIENSTPKAGYQPICLAPKWMYGYFLVFVKPSVNDEFDISYYEFWEGVKKNGMGIKLKYSKKKGVTIIKSK
ncbi:CRISPR-associated endonuclease Cas3'' [Candidatus Harpocratesius sp.]